jgi:broad specificity phosphatase PhoE
MQRAMAKAWAAVPAGDVVVVSHQLPIWVTHLAIAGLPLRHDPRARRCALSSVTSFEGGPGAWNEIAYAEPASAEGAVDVGAV